MIRVSLAIPEGEVPICPSEDEENNDVDSASDSHCSSAVRNAHCADGPRDSDSGDDAPPLLRDRSVSVGGTIRHNISTANLLSDEQRLELLQWASRFEGPWSQDVRDFPGPPTPAWGPPGAGMPGHGSAPGGEPYGPLFISGLECELFRNEYLAWCASVRLPEGHPDRGRRSNDLKDLRVHGDVYVPAEGRLMFDCNHAKTDIVPYAAFVNTKGDSRRIGALAGAGVPASAAPPAPGSNVGLLHIPVSGGAPPPMKGSSYKDYAYVRRELEALAIQLCERAVS